MLRFNQATSSNAVGNIKHRGTYMTGIVTADKGNGKYDVEIAGSGKPYIDIYTIEKKPDYIVSETVGILFEYGIREKPIICGILRDIQYIEVAASVNSLGV